MNTRKTLVSLIAAGLLLSFGQWAKAEIPFVISYYDNTWESVPLGSYAVGDYLNHVDPGETQGYTTLAACGMNVVNSSAQRGINLDLAQANGLMGMVGWDYGAYDIQGDIPYDPVFIDARAQSLVNTFSSHPALLGYRLQDEPSADEFDAIGLMHQKLVQYDPDCLPWVNLWPNFTYGAYGTGISSHKQYMDQYIAKAQPKVLCYDEYTSAYNTSYPENIYPAYMAYSNLETFREYSQANNIPFWRIIESNLGNTNTSPPTYPPSPNTEGIYRQQMYTSLAYGAKGVLYFTYTQQSGTQALVYGQHSAPTGSDWGTPTANGRYEIAQQVNSEVMTLAPLLMTLTSTKVCHTDPNMSPGGWYVHPDDRQYFNGLGASDYVTSISGGEMLVGEFEGDEGDKYLMFVNKDYVNEHYFSIKFDTSNVSAIGKISKDTGRVIVKSLSDGWLSRYFAAGDGDLYKILDDTTAASTPTNLNDAGRTITTISIDWDSSVDSESGIDYYVVYRNGVEIGTSSDSYFIDTGLQPFSGFLYKVSAVNGEGLESALSSYLLTGTLALYGDANTDGVVDEQDAAILASNWLTTSGATWYEGDFNGDGKVNEKDASILAANWGDTASSAVSVPEPGMMVILAGVLLMMGLRRRK